MTENCNVLILEDDRSLRQDLVDFLGLNNIVATGVENAKEFYKTFALSRPDVIIFDLILPDGNGIEIIKSIRDIGYEGKIIILTALNSEDQTVEGYEVGADAYFTKKTSMKVITACVKRLLDTISDKVEVSACVWQLDTVKRMLVVDGSQLVKLTSKEYLTSKVLMENVGKPFTRNSLAGIDGEMTPSAERRVDAVISRLRRKILTETGKQFPIDQVYGVGYTFSDHAEIIS